MTFKIDLAKLKSCLEFENSELKVTTSDIIYRGDRKCMIVSLQHARLKSSSVIFESETEALGVIDKGEESKIYLPSMLVRMFEIHNYVNNLKPFQDFPIFSLEFVYKNIYGKLLKSTFKVGLLTVEDKTNYSVYTIINQ